MLYFQDLSWQDQGQKENWGDFTRTSVYSPHTLPLWIQNDVYDSDGTVSEYPVYTDVFPNALCLVPNYFHPRFNEFTTMKQKDVKAAKARKKGGQYSSKDWGKQGWGHKRPREETDDYQSASQSTGSLRVQLTLSLIHI